jgi:hypothetical protein
LRRIVGAISVLWEARGGTENLPLACEKGAAIAFGHMRNSGVKWSRRARRLSKARRSNAGSARVRFLALSMTAALLAGCASSGDSALLLVDASKYQLYSCAQLAEATKTMSTRRQELETLIERAAQSPGGAFVGAVAYQTDYTAAGQELQVLASTSHSKKCDSPATWRSNSVIQ